MIWPTKYPYEDVIAEFPYIISYFDKNGVEYKNNAYEWLKNNIGKNFKFACYGGNKYMDLYQEGPGKLLPTHIFFKYEEDLLLFKLKFCS